MMNIPLENVYIEEDIGYDRVKELYYDLTNAIISRTRPLSSQTGIFGGEYLFKGFEWDRIKHYAL